jgi:uncharacterized membrane protein
MCVVLSVLLYFITKAVRVNFRGIICVKISYLHNYNCLYVATFLNALVRNKNFKKFLVVRFCEDFFLMSWKVEF